MQLRPFAPLAVIGAGLLAMSLATGPASAAGVGAPVDLAVTPSGSDLLLTWQPPASTEGMVDYELVVTDADTGAELAERSVDVDETETLVTSDDLDEHRDVVIGLSAKYRPGQEYPAESVRVTLPQTVTKPATPPSLFLQGRSLTVRLAPAGEGATGRVVQLYRDGEVWKTVSIAATKSRVTRKISGGHEYAAAYQDVSEQQAGPLSEVSATLETKDAADGPAPVKTVKAALVEGGLQVRWSAAAASSAEIEGYRVAVTQDGEHAGSGYSAAPEQAVVLPGGWSAGTYEITVVAKDAVGSTGSTSMSVLVGE